MNPATRLGLFALVLLASLGAGAAVGAAVGPIDTGDDPPAHEPAPPAPHDHRDHGF